MKIENAPNFLERLHVRKNDAVGTDVKDSFHLGRGVVQQFDEGLRPSGMYGTAHHGFRAVEVAVIPVDPDPVKAGEFHDLGKNGIAMVRTVPTLGCLESNHCRREAFIEG